MDGKKIKVTIDPLGNPTVEAIGFAGMGCQEATAGIEAALGGAMDARTIKPEAYSDSGESNQVHQSW
jgi:hypothetical protein